MHVLANDILDKPSIWKDANDFVLYQPVTPHLDAHGLVVAQLVHFIDGELETSSYYSRGWAYWNFLDIEGNDFTIANEAMDTEEDFFGQIDLTISLASEAVEQIAKDTIPHSNPYWQSLVVRMAYNALANHDEFVAICEQGNQSQKDVQRMIDTAIGAVLQNPDFTFAGFKKS